MWCSHRNRSLLPLCEGGFGPAACSQRECIWNCCAVAKSRAAVTHKVYPFLICIFFLVICLQLVARSNRWRHLRRALQNAEPPPARPSTRTPPHPDRVGHDRQHIPGELDSHLKQQSLSSLSLPSCRPRVPSFASADCITRLPSGFLGSDPLITRSACTPIAQTDCARIRSNICGDAHMHCGQGGTLVQRLYWPRSLGWNFMVGLRGGFWRLSSCRPNSLLHSLPSLCSLFPSDLLWVFFSLSSLLPLSPLRGCFTHLA